MPARVVYTDEVVNTAIERLPVLRKAGAEIRHTVHSAVMKTGPVGRFVADLLHGTWLGHPLHPVLTDITIGAWFFGSVFDLLAAATGLRRHREAADRLMEIGAMSAVPTALAGLTDYSTIKQEAVEHGAAHALLNSLALTLYLGSIRARHTRNRTLGLILSGIGLQMMLISAWLGGELVYKHRIGVRHGQRSGKLDHWTSVIRADELLESQPVRVDVDEMPVMLVRRYDQIYAIGATCAHAGGPLEQGKLVDHCIQCPWHDSVYDLRTGGRVHGPTTYNQPHFRTQVVNGWVQIRAAEIND